MAHFMHSTFNTENPDFEQAIQFYRSSKFTAHGTNIESNFIDQSPHGVQRIGLITSSEMIPKENNKNILGRNFDNQPLVEVVEELVDLVSLVKARFLWDE
jgi:hypothetical protein